MITIKYAFQSNQYQNIPDVSDISNANQIISPPTILADDFNEKRRIASKKIIYIILGVSTLLFVCVVFLSIFSYFTGNFGISTSLKSEGLTNRKPNEQFQCGENSHRCNYDQYYETEEIPGCSRCCCDVDSEPSHHFCSCESYDNQGYYSAEPSIEITSKPSILSSPKPTIQPIHSFTTSPTTLPAIELSVSSMPSLPSSPTLAPIIKKNEGLLKWQYHNSRDISFWPPNVGSDGKVYTGSNDHNVYIFSSTGILLKKLNTGGEINSSPAIALDGTIYVSCRDSHLYAFSSFGTLLWKYPIPTVYYQENQPPLYPSPAIGKDGTIYVGSQAYGPSYVYAITPNGNLKWKHRTDSWIFSSPAVGVDGTVYIGSNDCWLYAIGNNGVLKWKFQTDDYIWSSPAIGKDGTIYVGSRDCYIYAISATGSLTWRYRTGASVDSSPTLGIDGTIYVGSNDFNIYALTPAGSLKWKYKIGHFVVKSSPLVGLDGTVYVSSGDKFLLALSPVGELLWRFQTQGYVFYSPAIGLDGTLYVSSSDSYQRDGYLYAIH